MEQEIDVNYFSILAALMSQLINPNPMLRLRKVVTKEASPVAHLKAQSNPGGPGGDGNDAGNPGRPMTMMEQLQLKIQNRFKALHPEKQEADEGEESD